MKSIDLMKSTLAAGLLTLAAGSGCEDDPEVQQNVDARRVPAHTSAQQVMKSVNSDEALYQAENFRNVSLVANIFLVLGVAIMALAKKDNGKPATFRGSPNLTQLNVRAMATTLAQTAEGLTQLIQKAQADINAAQGIPGTAPVIIFTADMVISLQKTVTSSIRALSAAYGPDQAHLIVPLLNGLKLAQTLIAQKQLNAALLKVAGLKEVVDYLNAVSSDPSSDPKQRWADYMAAENIPRAWLHSDGNLINFFSLIGMKITDKWSPAFAKIAKDNFLRSAFEDHPDKTKNISDLTEKLAREAHYSLMTNSNVRGVFANETETAKYIAAYQFFNNNK